MRLALFAAASAAREPQSFWSAGSHDWSAWQFPNLREQAAHVFHPLQQLSAPDTPFIESVPDGVASRAIAIDDNAGSFVEKTNVPSERRRSPAEKKYVSDADRLSGKANEDGSFYLAEDTEAAPSDGYRDCALKDESCHCDSGTVRYGARGCTAFQERSNNCINRDEWTQPIKLGERVERVKCDLASMKEYRVWMRPEDGSPEPMSCQCLVRDITIQLDMGRSRGSSMLAATLLETTHNETQYLQVKEKLAHEMVCVQAGGVIESMLEVRDSALVEQEEVTSSTGSEQALTAVVKKCLTDNERAEGVSQDEKFIFYKSTGQLKHVQTKKCLTADFTTALPEVSLKECTLRESQHHIQRWDIPFYEMPNFLYGKGYIKLGYGSHSRYAYCLAVTSEVLDLVKCVGAQSQQWVVKAWEQSGSNPTGHEWKDCSAEDENCNCPDGEIRFGDADQNDWTPGVPAPSGGATACSLKKLRDMAVPDPVTSTKGGVQVKCQCRHDHFVDGDEDPKVANAHAWQEYNEFSAEHAPGMMTNAKAMMMSTYVGVGALLIGCICGGFAYFKWKQKQDWGEEEWYDEEEEEYEEEYEEYEEDE